MDERASTGHAVGEDVGSNAQSARPFQEGDASALRQLLAGGTRAGERTLAEWRWSGAGHPGGLRSWLACAGTAVTGHFATLPHRVRFDGGERIFAEVIDPLPHPAPRHTAQYDERADPGPLEEAARRLLAETCAPGGDLVVYAWPDDAEWDRLGRHLKFELVRTQPVLVREMAGVDRARPREVEPLTRFDEQALWLFDRCAGLFGAAVIRDAAFLNWRFFEHPRHEYSAFGVCDREGILRGYAVTRLVEAEGARSARVVDWLVPPAEVEVGELLREAVLAQAATERVADVRLVVPEWSPWFASFQAWGWLVLPSDQLLVSRGTVSRYDMQWLRDAWWYSWADCHLA